MGLPVMAPPTDVTEPDEPVLEVTEGDGRTLAPNGPGGCDARAGALALDSLNAFILAAMLPWLIMLAEADAWGGPGLLAALVDARGLMAARLTMTGGSEKAR